MNKRIFALTIVFALLLAACSLTPPASQTNTPVPPTQGVPATETIPPTQDVPPTHIPVDLTPAQRAAIQALAQQYNLPVDQIRLLNTEAVTWDNGCLGVVLPGKMCTQGQVEGFKLTLEANGRNFEYHTNQDGSSVLDAAQQLATLRLVVETSDHTLQFASPSLPLGATFNPSFGGLFSSGAGVNGSAYVLTLDQSAQVFVVDEAGTRSLDFVKDANYGLAVWTGGPSSAPRLAWGTQPGPTGASTLQISQLDGSEQTTLLTEAADAVPANQLIALAFSADGQALYFSKEPFGIGGYIPFGGASSLYRIDLATRAVTELIPFNPTSGVMTCLDALSADFRLAADHCTLNAIQVRDLQSGEITQVKAPEEASGFRLLGSARFSPDGKRLAFAMAKGDPGAEQGLIAISDGLSGASKVILTGEPGMYYTLKGWLDDQTLLLQSNAFNCGATCTNQVWTVNIDGSNLAKAADGMLLAVLAGR